MLGQEVRRPWCVRGWRHGVGVVRGQLGSVRVRVWVCRHMRGHVAVVLVVVVPCSTILVHVGVVGVWCMRGRGQRVEVIGRWVVCARCMFFSQLVQTAEHVCLHLEGRASVLAHQLHRVGIVIQVGGHGVLRVELHVGQRRGHARRRRWGLEREARWWWRG